MLSLKEKTSSYLESADWPSFGRQTLPIKIRLLLHVQPIKQNQPVEFNVTLIQASMVPITILLIS